jgi:uncharacterized protein YndB with AHSA1/START domain
MFALPHYNKAPGENIMQNENESKSTGTIERIYNASLETVWNLWATKTGFESWWGPQGFRADVHTLEASQGGELYYDMVADSPEMIAAMQGSGQPVSHPVHSQFTQVDPHRRLVLTNVIDFLPGVEAYNNDIIVDFESVPTGARMTVTLSRMHNDEFTQMQREGFSSQLTKLDARFAWTA